MKWIVAALAVLAAYVLAYIIARPSPGGTVPTWGEMDIYDEIASGPAD